LSISQKEADETLYWLEVLKETEYISITEFHSMEKDDIEIIKLLCVIIKTSKSK
jgi:four helix bundle protein